MTIPDVAGQYFPTKEEAKNVFLRTISAGAARYGLTVNVLPGSEYDLRAEAFAQLAVTIFANNKLGMAALSPLDAVGDTLIEQAGAHGVAERPASGASGLVHIKVTSGTVTIPAGFECTGENGIKYATVSLVVGAVDAELVSVIATEGGTATNLGAGSIVTWDSPSIGNLKRDATVGSAGLTGGEDADDEETVRQRWLERLANPGQGGNWSHIKQIAEASSASIHKAYPYPACNGPGSVGVALVSDSGSRAVETTVVNQAAADIAAELPGHVSLNVTTVTAEEVDIVLAVQAPLPVHAGGKGNAWYDATPWPNTASGPVKITAYNSTTGEITTDAVALNGVAVGSRIGIYEPPEDDTDEGVMHEYTVASATVSGTVKLTVTAGGLSYDVGPVGCYISAGAKGLTAWAETVVDSMNKLGPGEKTSSVFNRPRGLRKPTPDVEGPQQLGSNVLTLTQSAHAEILSIEYAARYETGTTTPQTSPSTPASPLDPPNILVLKHLAFRAITS